MNNVDVFNFGPLRSYVYVFFVLRNVFLSDPDFYEVMLLENVVSLK